MFGIFSRKRQYNDLSWIRVDMQSHILPGLDDGSGSVSESLSMLAGLRQLGIDQFYGTPHIFQRLYPNDDETIRKAFQQVSDELDDKSIRIGYAAKYMVDTDFDTFFKQKKELICLPDRHVLIQMSYLEENRTIMQSISRLLERGYKPILAHPERYVFYHQDPAQIKKFKDNGCLLQLNLLSAYGYYGLREKKASEYLISKGLVDLLGTDVRHERHVRALSHYVKKQDLSVLFKHKMPQNETLFRIPAAPTCTTFPIAY